MGAVFSALFGESVWAILQAILLLILAFIVAAIVKSLTVKLLTKTKLQKLLGKRDAESGQQVTEFIGKLLHLIVFLLFVPGIFERLEVTDMDGEYITRHEHEEFRRSMESENKRLEEENDRQNHRLNALEETVKQVAAISTSVEKLALNMENMLKEQVSQGKRLETLEGRDGEMWRKVVGYVVTAVVGIVVGFLFKQAGM